ncbi:MAG: sensor histidine kinase [Blautia sp.]|nr:sensor histidine kinase [Blautia sp.]
MSEQKKSLRWSDISLTAKVLAIVVLITLMMFSVNLIMYFRVSRMSDRLQQVYTSNVSLTELSESLDELQNTTYNYLLVKSSDTLESYYKCEEDYRNLLVYLNQQVTDDPVMLLERNIRRMSETYLAKTGDAITYKRGRNVEKYRKSFDEAQGLYRYLTGWIYELNSRQFRNNSENFASVQKALRVLALVSSFLTIVMMGVSSLMLYFMVRGVVRPLSDLATTARIVGEGNFRVKMPPTDARDEVGVLTRTFNNMVTSLEDYMRLTRENLEKEQQLKERELLMEANLKEAQLKYLQSQINPHFLFNSLNAGAQLAMMEDAEQTSIFVQRMADFFRYNVKKGTEDATLEEEVESVENYIYILNVRFAGDIHFSKEVDESVLDCRVPSMILQPVVENAVNHGIRDIEWEGRIHLSVAREEDDICIRVIDNGRGMTAEQIERVFSGKDMGSGNTGPDSTGIGIHNVQTRLELYYDQKDLMEIRSGGEGQGTEVIIRIPALQEEKENTVSLTDSTEQQEEV